MTIDAFLIDFITVCISYNDFSSFQVADLYWVEVDADSLGPGSKRGSFPCKKCLAVQSLGNTTSLVLF